ncbi:hypothetical protein YC2023_018726 [Brassica napus]
MEGKTYTFQVNSNNQQIYGKKSTTAEKSQNKNTFSEQKNDTLPNDDICIEKKIPKLEGSNHDKKIQVNVFTVAATKAINHYIALSSYTHREKIHDLKFGFPYKIQPFEGPPGNMKSTAGPRANGFPRDQQQESPLDLTGQHQRSCLS